MFISARRLPHEGILYEHKSSEAAWCFNVPANRSKFLNHFGPEITVKDRTYHVLIENAPLSFAPNNSAALADIEKKAGLNPIGKARYKPEARPTQINTLPTPSSPSTQRQQTRLSNLDYQSKGRIG